MASDQEDDVSSRPQSDSSAEDSDSQDSDTMPRANESAGSRRKSNNGSSKKSDPERQKRKKAKRACRPCQVAHLTCADERPCSRCVKRGCSHMCKDGVRKKAKYLADTPAEALTQELGTRGRPPVSTNQSFVSRPQMSNFSGAMPRNIYGQPTLFTPYRTTSQDPMSLAAMRPHSYENAPGILAPNYNMNNGTQSIPLQAYGPVAQQGPSMSSDPLQTEYGADLFAPFDSDYLDNLNFENRFAAAEFSMLGTMTSGIGNSPPSDNTGAFPSRSGTFTPNAATHSFAQSPVELQQLTYQQSQGAAQWSKDGQQGVKYESGPSQSNIRNLETLDRVIKQEAPAAYAIGTSAYPSPSSGSSPQAPVPNPPRLALSSAAAPNVDSFNFDDYAYPQRPDDPIQTPPQPFRGVQQRRFSPRKTAHIAKALATIRPSFISCTMRLNRDDLIFMEKCLQRTLWGLEEVVGATGTPTIICRRTGEVVAAGKEFSILTGWSKDVLLGKAANLNVNKGGDTSGLRGTAVSSRGGQNTPKPPDQKPYSPVNIVNLLDDESTCDFFDDYAHLAFGDSRGTVTTPCKLLRYRTAQDPGLNGDIENEVELRLRQQHDANPSMDRDDAHIPLPEQQDAKVECMLCWTVKRDVFDIPMLFVMNVLPCI